MPSLLNRIAPADDAEREAADRASSTPLYPATSRELNAELCNLLVYLEAPSVADEDDEAAGERPDAGRADRVRPRAARAEDRLDAAERGSSTSPGSSRRRTTRAATASTGFFKIMQGRRDRHALAPRKRPLCSRFSTPLRKRRPSAVAPPRPFVKKWTLDELVPLVEKGLKKRDFDRGRTLFAAANCFACHRFDSEGGSNGPDLTGLAGRFSAKDLLESIVDPSKVISDQYAVGRHSHARRPDGHRPDREPQRRRHCMINTDMLNPGGTRERASVPTSRRCSRRRSR